MYPWYYYLHVYIIYIYPTIKKIYIWEWIYGYTTPYEVWIWNPSTSLKPPTELFGQGAEHSVAPSVPAASSAISQKSFWNFCSDHEKYVGWFWWWFALNFKFDLGMIKIYQNPPHNDWWFMIDDLISVMMSFILWEDKQVDDYQPAANSCLLVVALVGCCDWFKLTCSANADSHQNTKWHFFPYCNNTNPEPSPAW